MKVLLLHGFNKNSRDMKSMANYLNEMGHECLLIDLKLTYKEFDYAVAELEDLIESLNLVKGEKIFLVGHSTGGLVIRKFISDSNYADIIGNCVLIATPNKGSKLADIATTVKGYTAIFRTLKSLTTSYIEKVEFKNESVAIGVIAGNKNNLLLGKLLKEENDGRVTIDSAYTIKAEDYITLPYGHKEIHHKIETARMVDAFIKYGQFKENSLIGEP